jgi:hypothetical protein
MSPGFASPSYSGSILANSKASASISDSLSATTRERGCSYYANTTQLLGNVMRVLGELGLSYPCRSYSPSRESIREEL